MSPASPSRIRVPERPSAGAGGHGAATGLRRLARRVVVFCRRWPSAPLVLAAWLALCAALVVAGEWHVAGIERAVRDDIGRRAEAGAEALERYLVRTLDGIEVMLDLTRTLASLQEGDPRARVLLDAAAADFARSGRLGVLDAGYLGPDGRVIWSTDPDRMGDNLRGRRIIGNILQGQAGLQVGVPRPGPVPGHYVMHVARPDRGLDGRLAGIAVVAVDPVAMSREMASLQLLPTDRVAVLRLPDARFIARPRLTEEAMHRTLPPSNAVLQAFRSSLSGRVEFDADSDGRPLIGAFQRITGVPLLAIFAIDPAPQMDMVAAFARSIRMAYVAISLGIGATLLVVFVVRTRWRAALELGAIRALDADKDRLLGAVPAIVINGVIDADGTYHKRYISPSVELVTGWPASALADDDCWTRLCDPASVPAWFKDRRAALGAEEQTAEFRMRRPDGGWMWVRKHSRVIRRYPDGGGEVVGYIVDISRERELAAQAAGAAKLATLGEMATSLAHELNQPIAVMVAAADNVQAELEDGPVAPSDAVTQRLHRIGEQGHRASVIIDHLRQFGRPGTEETTAVDLAEVIEGARILTGGGLRQARIALEVSVPADLPRVRAQRMPLEQVLVNLLANARDALEKLPPDTSRRLRIAARELGGRVVVEVADNGGGIAPEVMARIFQPFVTTKAIATQGTAQGTGLGLAVSYGMLKSFGGAIVAANADGGAVFTMTLRCWSDDNAALRGQGRHEGLSA